jgi:hypothetical protein
MKKIVEELGNSNIDGEKMFDYLSYVYLGWRTTGGTWQNQVIDTFIIDQLKEAGYTYNGAETTPYGQKSSNDMSSATDDDYTWVTYFDVDTLTWDPEYAKLEITTDAEFTGKDALIESINVESYSFNPTTDTYLNYYGKSSIDEMWQWITEKDSSGNRINVLNGKEAELNKRCHLAWNSCFTDDRGTEPEDATGVTGEIVYVGSVTSKDGIYSCSKVEDVTTLKGKVLLSDSSLKVTFGLAQQVGAVAIMSKSSLASYSTPKDEDGNILAPFNTSARYAAGAALATTAEQTASGSPIVEWQFSNEQYDALKTLLQKSDKPVYAKNVSIGTTYAMNDASMGGKGQAIAVAEIKGSTKADERIFICAHVQEPGSNDNATGVASLLQLATALKTMVDNGDIERPERTITFMWGDEMNMATYYLDSHPDEKAKIIASLDMDMVGEDTEQTGGAMRIEKTPDPSAVYNYTLDTLPWEDGSAYNEYFADTDGNFVRLPDSHTLWGAGDFDNLFNTGFYLNDLYMYATQTVIDNHDSTFKVEVCPYEGGSDHSRFLEQNIPALLTWHMTDYTYHTSVDTLAMSSATEMENVGITTLAAALVMANATDENVDVAVELLDEVHKAALERFDVEEQNTINHRIYVDALEVDEDSEVDKYEAALANEIEVLEAWEQWYQEAYDSVEDSLLENPSDEYLAIKEIYSKELAERLAKAVAFAEDTLTGELDSEGTVNNPVASAPSNTTPSTTTTTTSQGKTGDTANLIVWTLVAIAGASVATATFVIYRRRQTSK